jgi:uncharacterized protein YuzE
LSESHGFEDYESNPGVIVDYDDQGRVVAVEFLNISTRASQEQLNSIQLQLA